MPQLVNPIFGCNITSNDFSVANSAALFAATVSGTNAQNIFSAVLAGTDHTGLTTLVTAAIGQIGTVPRGAANSFTPGRIRDAFALCCAQAAPNAPGVSGLAILLAGPPPDFSNPALKLAFVALHATLRNSVAAPAPVGRIFGRSAPLQGAAVGGESNGACIIRDLLAVCPQLLPGAAPPALAVPAPAASALVVPAPVIPTAVTALPAAPAPVLAAPGPAAALLVGLPPVPPAVPAHPVAAAIQNAQQRQAAMAIPAPLKSTAGAWSGPPIAANQQHWVSQFNTDNRMGSNVAFSLVYEAVARSTTPEAALIELRMIEAIFRKFSPIGEGGDMALLALRADCDKLSIFSKTRFPRVLAAPPGPRPSGSPSLRPHSQHDKTRHGRRQAPQGHGQRLQHRPT